MTKRSISRRTAALIAGTAMASGIMASNAAAQDPPGRFGAPVEATAPPVIEAASDQGPAGVDPRVGGFKQCANGGVCIFRGQNYSIWKVRVGQALVGWRSILIDSSNVARRHYSAKNRFANRRLLLRGTRANGTWARFCLNPGGSRPGPLGPGMLQFKIGAPGSRC